MPSVITIRAFDLSPDRQHIVFDRVRQNADVILFELDSRDS